MNDTDPNPARTAKIFRRRMRDRLAKELGNRFTKGAILRRVPVGPYIVDFYIEPARLAVNVDRFLTDDPDDQYRAALLEEHGVAILCFLSSQIFEDVGRIVQAIWEQAQKRI